MLGRGCTILHRSGNRIQIQSRAAYSRLGRTKVLYATSLVQTTISCKGKQVSYLLWKNFLKCVNPNPYYHKWLNQGILPTERFPKIFKFVCFMLLFNSSYAVYNLRF